MENVDPTIMRDDTLGKECYHHRLTQIIRPQSAPADGKVMPIQTGPMLGMQPAMDGPGPSAHALSHLTPQAHMFQQQQQQMFAQNPALAMQSQQRQAMLRQQQQQQQQQHMMQQNGMMGFPHGGNQVMNPQQIAAMQGNPQLQVNLPPHLRAQLAQNQAMQQQQHAQAQAQQQAQQQQLMAQHHTAMHHAASQQSNPGQGGPQNKQQPLGPRSGSTTMSKERQSMTKCTLPAPTEAVDSGGAEVHLQTPVPDQTNSWTPNSIMGNRCAELEKPEELSGDHGSEAILDTSSSGVFDAVSDGCRRDAQLYPAQAEPSLLDSRTTFHKSKRRRIDRSHSPTSFPEFSCETCHRAQVQLQNLCYKVFDLEVENQQLKKETSNAIKGPPVALQPYFDLKWITIYEVSEHESTRWYEDQPRWLQTQNRQVRLAGKKRIFNLKAFSRQLQLGKVPFIVFQEFTNLRHPDTSAQHIQSWSSPTSSNVSIQIVSNRLSKAFDALLKVHNELKKHADFQGNLYDYDNLDDDSSLDEDESDHARRMGERLVNIDLLYFHFQDLFETGLSSRTEDDRSETELLLRFLRTGFKRNHTCARKLLSQKKISRNTICYLFKPGALIVFDKAPRIKGLKQINFLRSSSPSWKLDCQSWTFDGKFHQEDNTLSLAEKDLENGPVNITSLPFYPLGYARPEIDQKLRYRGDMFWKCRKQAYVTYSGLNMRGDIAYDQARFLIDTVTWKHYQQGPSAANGEIWNVTTMQPGELDEGLMLPNDPPSADFLYLVPENITGFSMQDKKWVDLQVDNISEVQWDKRSFDNLAIAKESKNIIKALVLNKIARDKATDVVPGKGNGLVVLLHGGPGTGKTLTAESVADLAEKPLYRVTCGDIGTEPRKVEEYLENVFFLGKIWDCVVLLDEADVFLEQRSLSDLPRNALVSVFLRTLEYYDGILILTSNRVGTFDEAFKSRIQLALHYDSLTEEQRKHIWYTFIKRLEELNEPMETGDIYMNIETLSKEQLNGRQIRNAITTARQLALFEDKKLSVRHLKESIKVSGQFDEYLQDLHGPDDTRMQNEGIRLAPRSHPK